MNKSLLKQIIREEIESSLPRTTNEEMEPNNDSHVFILFGDSSEESGIIGVYSSLSKATEAKNRFTGSGYDKIRILKAYLDEYLDYGGVDQDL